MNSKMLKILTSNKVFEIFKHLDILVNKTVYQIINVILIRSLMIIVCAFQLYTLVCATGETPYLGIIIFGIMIIVDTILICIFRSGNERTW